MLGGSHPRSQPRASQSESLRSGFVSDTRQVPGRIDALIPYAHVADVQRSIAFYAQLGLEELNRYEPEGRLVWAFVGNDAGARLMLALADEPVDPARQAVLYYVWTPDVRALHSELGARGIAVGDIRHPFYMPTGEFKVEDPDGYVLLVGQQG